MRVVLCVLYPYCQVSPCNQSSINVHQNAFALLKYIWNWVSEMSAILCAESVNTLRLKQNGRHFPEDIFKCIFLNENVWISIKISLKFVPKVPINNIPVLVQIMSGRRQAII